jgi:nucleotidyltransferase substrate binding protein (TIGR01987 family)
MTGHESSRLATFDQSLRRLEEALKLPEDAIVRDASIQRFEFTFEMAWRAVQAYAQREGLTCESPRECWRVAFRLRLVEDDRRWMAMVEDRNRSSHTYDEEGAKAIYDALRDYALLLRGLLDRLRTGEVRHGFDDKGA